MVKRLCLAWKRNKQNKDKGVEPTGACSLFAQKTPESKQKENIMKSKMFEKETFKKEVVENVKYLYRKTMDEASEQEIFQAVSYVVKDVIIDQWLATQQEFDKADPKIVYYMSMEFLMGRALGNNLINLTVYNEVKEALEEMGINLNAIEDQEPDPALGNGGLGRLAACFMESLATLGYPAYGCGIRYHYGMFRQKIENGYQVEEPDNWLQNGYPFELKRPEYNFEVKFGGYVRAEAQPDGRTRFVQEGYQSVKAIPYDMPIVGYNNNVVNTLMIWDAEPMECFELDSFDKGDYHRAIEQQNLAKNLVEVLYPNDNHIAGKELRLKQQYFFVSASLQRAIARFKKNHPDIHMLPEKAVFQMNDTHPTVAVAELMRILLDEEGLEWDDAWNITTKCCAYTNHTIMAEALEKWPIEIFSRLLPRIYQIVEEINRRFVLEIQQKYPGDNHKVEKMAIIYDGQVKMAHLAICAGYSVNGVAALHTEILKKQELKDFYEMFPEKFNNKTNGITQRRFLMHGDPLLADWVTKYVGKDWITDLSRIKRLEFYADDEKVQQEFLNIKYQNKLRLASYIEEHNGIEVNPRSSRTVPYISKVTGIPIVDLATKVMTGMKLKELGYEPGLQPESPYWAIKMPVFSFEKIRGADISLGPEMKSTGECLGISKNYEEALFKAFLGSGVDLPKHKKMIMTVKDSDKLDAVEVGKRFAALGYEIYATRNTCKTLQESGVPAKRVNKIEETHPNLLDLILGHQIDLIIDTPSQGIERSKDGFVIRRHAVETGVNCLTSLDTANALLTSLESSCREDLSLVDIAEIDKEIERKINEA